MFNLLPNFGSSVIFAVQDWLTNKYPDNSVRYKLNGKNGGVGRFVKLAPLANKNNHVPRQTYKIGMHEVQEDQLLVREKQEKSWAKNRAQKVLQLVSDKDRSQGGEEVGEISAGSTNLPLPRSLNLR